MEKKRTSIKHHIKKITISEVSCDISHLINLDMPIYPRNPSPKFESILNIQKDGVNVSRITLGTHTGTHVDSQNHFFTNGIGIEREPLSKFIGQAIVLHFSKKTIGDGISSYDLNYYSKRVDDTGPMAFD
jgi:kynurenine formamidase